ncbi:MAG: hypothetical protein JXB62_15770 [Pirellulales bacterium]|nr:hypothetical protein [Pirellulales bacterium]
MPIALQSFDVVVVGRFNPYIVTPQWLHKEGMCQSESAEVAIGWSPSGPSVFSFSLDDFRWQVSDSRLMVSANTAGLDPAERVARVVEKLPHTPVSALGHNFHYRSEIGKWEGGLPKIGELDGQGIEQFGKLRQLSWSCALELHDLVFNMTLERREGSIEINTNLHREVSEIEQVMEMAEGFGGDLALSHRLIQSITKERVATND